MKAKPSKCVFAAKEVVFLGHIVGENGVSTDPEKVRGMTAFELPNDVDELPQFLGSVNYNRFVAHYVEISAPLHMLLKKGVEYDFGVGQNVAFKNLKLAVSTTPVLACPDFSRPFRLDTDASGVGVGPVLSQSYGDSDRPIAFYSKTFSSAKRNYTVIEQEMLAIILAQNRRFRPYILGTELHIFTDHQPLKYLLS